MSLVDTLVKVDPAKAKVALEGLVASRREKSRLSPDDLVALRDYANILQREANACLKEGNFDSAVIVFQEARDIYANLVERDPANGQAPRDLSWIEYFLGKAIVDSGNVTKGLERIEVGLGLVKDCCIASPNDARPRENVVLYTELYVHLCEEMKQLQRAESVIRSLLVDFQPIVEQNPDNYAFAEMFSTVKTYLKQVEKNIASVE
jgi:tetratricopeptide (TPR) repeat protein